LNFLALKRFLTHIKLHRIIILVLQARGI
jgi:hypothetical protein